MNYFIAGSVSYLFDCLSQFFVVVILIVSLPSLVYSFGYLKGLSAKKMFLAQGLAVIFILSMVAVVTSANIFSFLIAWEIMSLVSYFLVVFEHEHEQSVKAGTMYIIMTHIGTAFIIAAFMILYRYANSFDLITIKNACLVMPNSLKNLVFAFLLIGFGTKAGIVPLHIWLPYAHPQAPSHISSIMSGVMIKTAVYGMIRFIIFVLGVNNIWWGIFIIIFAAISCLTGVIYALMENDIKKLLAYSSVENMGIILLGLGTSMLFLSLNLSYLAVLALIASLYHLINHAVFKGLLFLGAGSIYKTCGTRDIEKMGGLIHKMPWTAGIFLIGSMAISALPPLNGFISEWLTLQAFFLGALSVSLGLKLFFGLCAAVLAFTGGLAAACFVKAFGITFLALPRSKPAQDAQEAPACMVSSMLFMAGWVIFLGLGVTWVMNLLSKVAGSALNIEVTGMSFKLNNFIASLRSENGIYISPFLFAIVLILIIVLTIIVFGFLKNNKRSIYNTWDCGYYNLDSRNEYSSTAFSKPFRIAFSFFLFPYRRTQKIRDSFYHVKSFSYETHTKKIFKEFIYDPALSLILNLARRMRKIQPGSIHLYIAYIFLTLILLVICINRF